MRVQFFTLLFFIALITLSASVVQAQCITPPGTPGEIIYNNGENVFQGCTAAGWVAFQQPKLGFDIGPKSGLIGYWKLDETSGTFADSSGNGLTGTATAGIGYAQAGAVGNAANFDGADVGISIPYDPLFVPASGQLTIAFWIKPSVDWDDEPDDIWGIIENHTGGSNTGWSITVSGFNGETIRFETHDGTAQDTLITTPGLDWDQNRWYHIAVVFDNASYEASFYRDGEFINTDDTGGNTFMDFGSNDLFIGYGASNGDMEGLMDDVRIYDRILDPEEVEQLYNLGRPPYATCNTIGQVCEDGTVYAGLSPDSNVPMYTTASDLGLFPWNNGNSSDTIEVDIKDDVTGSANTASLLSLDSDLGNAGIQPHQAAQVCYNLESNNYSDWYLPAKDELNVLYQNHVTIGGFNTSGISPNGIYQSSTEFDQNVRETQNFSNGSQGSNNKHTALQTRCVRKQPLHTSCFYPSGMKGDIIYNENRDVFQGCNGRYWEAFHSPAIAPSIDLAAYWPLDGTSLEGPFPDLASGSDATPNTVLSIDLGISGNAVDHQLVGGNFARSNFPSNSRLENMTSFTFSTWVNHRNFIQIQGLIDIPNLFTIYKNFNDNHYWFRANAWSDNPGLWRHPSGFLANEWNHIAMSYSYDDPVGTNPVFYFNGVRVNVTNEQSTPDGIKNVVAVSSGFFGNANISGSSRAFRGLMDDIRIYDRILTDLEISDIYNEFAGRDITKDLIGHWKLDDTSGPNAIDSSGNGNNGTFTGSYDPSARTTTGVIDNALSFNGVSGDGINLGAMPLQAGNHTMSFWLNVDPAAPETIRAFSRNNFHFMQLRDDDNDGIRSFDLRLRGTNDQGPATGHNVWTEVVQDGVWHHFAYVADATETRIYLDGILLNTLPAVTENLDTDDLGINLIGEPYTGALDDFRIYGRALSNEEVAALYYKTKGITCLLPEGTPGEIMFNQGEDVFQGCTRAGWKALGSVLGP